MSKAFVNEDSEVEEDDVEERDSKATLAPGQKNYITPLGFRRLQAELHHLKAKERPAVTEVVAWAASNGDRSENADYKYGKQKLREIDRRIRFLSKRIDLAEVVDPTKNQADRVYFGATVTIQDEDGEEKTYSIVGVDEMDVDKGKISWVSPLASALLKAQVGDWVTFKTPKGTRDVEVIAIRYVEIED